MKIIRNFLIWICILLVSPVFADINELRIPESSSIRKSIADSWFYSDLKDLRYKRAELRVNSVGEKFQIRLEESSETYAIIVAPEVLVEVDLYTESGVEQRVVSEFPYNEKGSWILIKNAETQKTESIKIYFTENKDVYVQFSPNGNKILADYIIDGLYAAKGVPIGIPFNRLYTISFEEVLSLTKKSLPWNYSVIFPGQYDSKLQMIGVIRKNLSRIAYADDACYDENGKPIYISDGSSRTVYKTETENNILTLSSTGFLKWIADGLVESFVGGGIYREPLLRKTVTPNPLSLAGVLSETEDLYFPLDWTRNLAAACLSLRTQKKYLWENAGVDVTVEPFASEISSSGSTQTVGYLKDSGYEISKLKPLLYVLGVTEPTYCYFAAIRRPIKNSVGKPEYYKFDQCAVIFPYFDKDKKFSCVIFENGTELTLNSFINKNKGCFVHLTRILSNEKFFPQ